MATKSRTMGEYHTGGTIRDFDIGDDLVRTTSRVDGHAFRYRSRARIVDVPFTWRFRRWTFNIKYFQSGTVVERQHKVFVRLFEPCLDERLQLLGVLFSQVFRLGTVDVCVIELPGIFVEVAFARQRGMEGNRLPTVFPETAGTQHGVVLPLLLGEPVRLSLKRVAHRDAR